MSSATSTSDSSGRAQHWHEYAVPLGLHDFPPVPRNPQPQKDPQHEFPHDPQFPPCERSVSQPLPGLLSQSPQFAVHPRQVPALQVV